MVWPELIGYSDWSLLLLRLAVAAVFISSGWSHAREPEDRGESIGLPTPVALAVGVVEVVGGVMLALGLWVQVAALLLIGVMLGALYKKIFVWKKGFWGEEGGGWYYDLLYLICNLVLLTTGGGGIALT